MRLSCTVCYEQFIPTDNVHVAPCGHMLHLNCWTEWLGRSKNCPDCRKPTQVNQLIKLFFNIGEGDDYTTLSNKYDALRCDLSCKTKDCENAEKKLKIQTQENASLRNSILQLKVEKEEWKRKAGTVPTESNTASVKLSMGMYKNLLKSKADSESALTRNKELAEEVGRLKRMAEELEKSKKVKAPSDNSAKCSEADLRVLKSCESVVKNLKRCLKDYEELKKNSTFLKSLKAYTDLVHPETDMWDDLDDNPQNYVDLFKDVKKYFEQAQRREEEVHQSPLGCVLALDGIPQNCALDWRLIRAAVEHQEGYVAFTTYQPGDKVAYVRLENCYPGEAPAFRFVRSMNGRRLMVNGIAMTVRALTHLEEITFLKKSLEDRDRRNRERFRRRRGFNDTLENEDTLLDYTIRMASECNTTENGVVRTPTRK